MTRDEEAELIIARLQGNDILFHVFRSADFWIYYNQNHVEWLLKEQLNNTAWWNRMTEDKPGVDEFLRRFAHA